MTNLQDYVRWRGDLSLNERPFNDVDNLVLSALAYLDLDGVVPGPGAGDPVTVLEATATIARGRSRPEAVAQRLNIVSETLLDDMGRADRYKSALLSNYVDVIDTTDGLQFAALTVQLADGTVYVAFRGTDNAIVGWHEDLTMSFQVMPAQTQAAAYLGQVASRTPRPLRVGGHSKGGNLAVFAAMRLPAAEQARILAVYSNDGPGLSPDVLEPVALQRISDRIVRIVPEFALIGMLFDLGTSVRIVASNERGLLQHDLMTWIVEGTDICERPRIASRAAAINSSISSWLQNATREDRRALTNALFGALTAGGATLTSQISQTQFGSYESVLLALGRARRETRRPLRAALRLATRTALRPDDRGLWIDGRTLRLVAVMAMGVFFIVVPDLAVQILGSMTVLTFTVWGSARLGRYVKRFRRTHHVTWRFIAVQLVLISVITLTISQINLLVIPTNMLLGLAFLAHAWASSKASMPLFVRAPQRRARGTWLLMSAGASLIFGVIALSTAGEVHPVFVIEAGQYWIVAAMVTLLLDLRDRLRRNDPGLQRSGRTLS